MLKEIRYYQAQAVKKPVYLCLAILDPQSSREVASDQPANSRDGVSQRQIQVTSLIYALSFSTSPYSNVEVLETPQEEADSDSDTPRHYTKHHVSVSPEKPVHN